MLFLKLWGVGTALVALFIVSLLLVAGVGISFAMWNLEFITNLYHQISWASIRGLIVISSVVGGFLALVAWVDDE